MTYPHGASRDERFDMLRGFACISFVVSHFEAFNWLNFIFWERLGIISGAGLFVVVSGLLIGITHRDIIDRKSKPGSTERLWRRSGTIYLAYVTAVLIVGAVRATGLIDMTAVSTFTDRWTKIQHPLYPTAPLPLYEYILGVLTLKFTPHQIQILGFYVVMLLIAPVAIRELKLRRFWTVLITSWALYGFYQFHPVRITPFQFEYGFPLLAWQIYFFAALVVGYFARYELPLWLAKNAKQRRVIVAVTGIVTLSSFIFAQTTDNGLFPPWTRLDLIRPETFRSWYDAYFVKDSLGPLRVVSEVSFFITAYSAMSYGWVPIHRALGWFLLPLGRNSLYVFLVHLAFIAAADQIPGYFDAVSPFDWSTVWFNTAVVMLIIGGLWLMVTRRVLFRIIPR